MIDTEKLSEKLRKFSKERDWDQFHTPKNLACSIAVESSELLELFQWSKGQSDWGVISEIEFREKVEKELADILLYVIRFADKANIDLQLACEKKIIENSQKYPVEKFKGSDRKYNE
jgi:NTP pyrophosphatase (non-canonical NTP hydrolase)